MPGFPIFDIMGLEFPVILNFRNSKPIISNTRFLLIHQWTQATASRQSPRPVPLASHLSTIQIKSRFSLAGIQWGSSWGTVGCVWQSLERIPVDLGGGGVFLCNVSGVCMVFAAKCTLNCGGRSVRPGKNAFGF